MIRETRKIFHIDVAEEENYNKKIIADAKGKLMPIAAPAMPVVYYSAVAQGNLEQVSETKEDHVDTIAPVGHTSDAYYALLHTSIPQRDAVKIPKARAAINTACDRLGVKRKAWLLETVKERYEGD